MPYLPQNEYCTLALPFLEYLRTLMRRRFKRDSVQLQPLEPNVNAQLGLQGYYGSAPGLCV
jgi:hypothetical protein